MLRFSTTGRGGKRYKVDQGIEISEANGYLGISNPLGHPTVWITREELDAVLPLMEQYVKMGQLPFGDMTEQVLDGEGKPLSQAKEER